MHVLPDFLRIEAVEDIAQDQLSATVPGVEVVAYPFARALSVLAPPARLVVMPDDAALGEHRSAFAGGAWHSLEYPLPGFEGTTEIQDHDAFWEERQEDPWNRPDTRAYLRARLLDFFLGDWDRHSGQWRWARVPGDRLLQPVVEDRDQVFCDFEGLAMSAARASGTQLVKFEPKYSPIDHSTQNGWDLDRFLLTDLARDEWMQVSRDVQAKLTDDVIEQGLRRLPPEYYALVGADLTTVLRARRDGLAAYSERYYEFMAKEVDVQGSNQAEVATIRHVSDEFIEVQLARPGDDEPFYTRRFDEDETKEIRIYLHDGDDRVVLNGEGRADIAVYIMGGRGDDTVESSGDYHVVLWDYEGDNVVPGNVDVRAAPFHDPELKMPNENVPRVPSRDFGRFSKPISAFGFHGDAGLIFGGGLDITDYGFRRYPWATRTVLKGAFAICVNRPMIDYQGDIRRRGGRLALRPRGAPVRTRPAALLRFR